MSTDLDVAVVGAGMAGLTAAAELSRAGLAVRVFEACPHVGGRTAAFRHDGYTVDTGAEQISLRGYRATWQLLARLGVRTDEVPAIDKPIAMWRAGHAHPGVAGPWGLLSGAGLSARARLDLARLQAWAARRRAEFDTDHPQRAPLAGTTVAEFARRYHRDLLDYLFQPLADGFLGWRAERSSAAVLLSLLLAVGSSSGWRSYRGGMDLLARRLADGLDVATGHEVRRVVGERDTARLHVGSGTVTARCALLCVPAPEAARLHEHPSDAAAEYLSACTFTPALKVSCLLDRPLAVPGSAHPYLLLTPNVEEDVVSAVVLGHKKNPDRAPAGGGLVTLLPAAATTRDLLEARDEDVIARLTRAATRYLPGFAAANRQNFVHRFRHGLPEATPEALRLRSRFLTREIGPVDYGGDWVMLRPASEGAVRSGALAASRALSHLRGDPSRTTHPSRARSPLETS